jgi:hypothetical protein
MATWPRTTYLPIENNKTVPMNFKWRLIVVKEEAESRLYLAKYGIFLPCCIFVVKPASDLYTK